MLGPLLVTMLGTLLVTMFVTLLVTMLGTMLVTLLVTMLGPLLGTLLVSMIGPLLGTLVATVLGTLSCSVFGVVRHYQTFPLRPPFSLLGPMSCSVKSLIVCGRLYTCTGYQDFYRLNWDTEIRNWPTGQSSFPYFFPNPDSCHRGFYNKTMVAVVNSRPWSPDCKQARSYFSISYSISCSNNLGGTHLNWRFDVVA